MLSFFAERNMDNLLGEILQLTRAWFGMHCSNNFSDRCHCKVLLAGIRSFPRYISHILPLNPDKFNTNDTLLFCYYREVIYDII